MGVVLSEYLDKSHNFTNLIFNDVITLELYAQEGLITRGRGVVITRCNFFLHVDGPVTGGGRYLIRLVGWGGGAYKQQFMVCGMCLTLSGGTEKIYLGTAILVGPTAT